ncbi:hypothetical protein BB560_003388 [Smittium megazygosporum]|uniref:Uncharacterized protein n=1 Tax=Smittium megazygosporum TaxID=133381 RepID=A0A2T9ZC80_9FUNG|nr:hypothetical protein BB560_003388 [Smittium megazygosporum]
MAEPLKKSYPKLTPVGKSSMRQNLFPPNNEPKKEPEISSKTIKPSTPVPQKSMGLFASVRAKSRKTMNPDDFSRNRYYNNSNLQNENMPSSKVEDNNQVNQTQGSGYSRLISRFSPKKSFFSPLSSSAAEPSSRTSVLDDIKNQTSFKEIKTEPVQPPVPAQNIVNPLIPESYVDSPTQRKYFLAATVLLISLLIVDIGLSFLELSSLKKTRGVDVEDYKELQRKNSWRFLKWLLAFALYSFSIWILRIPRIALNKNQALALFFFLAFLNLNIFVLKDNIFSVVVRASLSTVSTGLARLVWNIPFAGQSLLQDSDLLLGGYTEPEDNILGKYVVQVLPLSSVMVNPSGKYYCVTKEQRISSVFDSTLVPIFGQPKPTFSSAYIPLQFNGTQVYKLKYKHISLEDGKETTISQKIDRKYVKVTKTYKEPKNWQLATYLFKVSSPGIYSILSVTDRKGKMFRINQASNDLYNGNVVVVECPNGRLEWVKDNSDERDQVKHIDNEIHICSRNLDSGFFNSMSGLSIATYNHNGLLQVSASGYEPLELMIVRVFNGREEILSLDGIQPREQESRLLEDKNLLWKKFQSRELRYSIAESFVGPGEYVYRLMYVRDGCNNTRTLYGSSTTKRGVVERESIDTAIKTGKIARIKVWARPRITWKDSITPGVSFKKSSDPQKKGPIRLPFVVSGVSPWVVQYQIDPLGPDGGASAEPDSAVTNSNVKTLKVSGDGNGVIEAYEPGIYKLISVSDTRCRGGQIDAASVTIIDTKPPELSVSSQSISSEKCIGEIGTRIDLLLKGEGPFTVHYKEHVNSQTFDRKVKIPINKHTLRLTPDFPGLYEYTFYKVEDNNYPSGVKTHSIVRQVVHPQPSMKLIGSDLKHSCMGQKIDVDIQFLGHGPWELTYSIIQPTSATLTETITSHKNSTSISVGPFKDSGVHAVEFIEIADSRKCRRRLQIRSTIVVREGGPTAEFVCPAGGIKTLEGNTAKLPVRVQGEGSITLTYIWHGNTSNTLTEKVFNKDNTNSVHEVELPATNIGTYELLMVYDYCSGSIGIKSRCSVSVEPKPRVWFRSQVLSSEEIPIVPQTCQSNQISGSMINIELEGHGPWIVRYSAQRWNSGEESDDPDAESIHTSVVVGQNPLSLKLNATLPGLYKYTLLDVSDQLYMTPQKVVHSALRPSMVKQKVTPTPVGSLTVYSADGNVAFSSKNKPDTDVSLDSKGDNSPIQLCIPRGSPVSDYSEIQKIYGEYAPKVQLQIEELPMVSPPFTAWIELSSANSPSRIFETPQITTFNYTLDLSSYLISHIGRFGLRILKVIDSNGCTYSQTNLGGDMVEAGMEIEYIEAPTIRPLDPMPNDRDLTIETHKNSQVDSPSNSVYTEPYHVCKGDVVSMEVLGYPPWSIHYSYNERMKTVSINKPVFKKLMDSAGIFSVDKVCHLVTNSCCSRFANLKYNVHALPSAKISGGQNVKQSINQGERVEINIELKGEPPFTFTWQRKSLPVQGDRKVLGKILESHTIQNYNNYTYTLVTSLEGVFQVTYIQDKHCYYPRSKPN